MTPGPQSEQHRGTMSRSCRPCPEGEDGERLTAAAATCPVCLSILLEPVTMPCRHTLCMPCFDATVEQAALSCPLCRTRISVWLRRTRRSGRLVDERLWARLQRDFPEKVQARREGREADFSEEDLEPVPLHLSAPGEIRLEFERQLEAVRDEEQERRSRSERASRELIDQLQEETAQEARERQEQERRDAELARGVMQEQEMFVSPGRPVDSAGDRHQGGGRHPQRPVSTPVRGPMDVYIGQLTPRVGGKRPVSPIRPPAAPAPAPQATPSPSGSGKENSDPAGVGAGRSPDSADSIRPELRHFKPIRAAPRTPPRRRPDGVLGVPPVVHAVARLLDCQRDRAAAETVTSAETGERHQGSRRGLSSQEIRARLGQPDSEDGPCGPCDAGGDGGVAPGKRPADRQGVAAARPAKRRPPPDRPDERELPRLALQPEPELESEMELELDLESAELLEQQREAERLLELELADRRLAEQLQRELNTVPPVDRSKGSADAYSLRGPAAGRQTTPSSRAQKRSAASRRRAAPPGRDRAQLSIQESLGRSQARRPGR